MTDILYRLGGKPGRYSRGHKVIMILYHGSDKPITVPSIPISEIGREFGIGFYTYSEEAPALRQAELAVKRAFLFDGSRPVVSRFHFDQERAERETRLLILKDFDEIWLNFIFQCYTDIHFVHSYDIVIGNAVTAPVKEALEQYRHKRADKAETISSLSAVIPVKQFCFTTVNALNYLQCID